MSPDTAITVTDLHKDFLLPHQRQSSIKHVLMRQRNVVEPQHVLNGVSFEIPKGEFFGIVGRNGSGKSTLLKILAGIYQPTTGAVERTGSLVPLIELGVGFNTELTGRENVYLNGAMHGFSRREMLEIYDEIVEFAGLADFMEQKLKNYSSGMQVRLAFSIATHAKADILLIDEVLAVGDADFQRKCLAYFSELKLSNTTVIFVSHDMNAVREYCDRAVLLERGGVVVSGTAEEVAQAYTRLFTPEVKNLQHGLGERLGVGGATFESVEVAPEFTELDEEIAITATVKPSGGTPHVRTGFVVYNKAGEQVCGSGSVPANVANARAFEVSEARRIRWTIPNVLNDGEYSIWVTMTDTESRETVESWKDAAHFAIRRTQRVPYSVIPPIAFEFVGESASQPGR